MLQSGYWHIVLDSLLTMFNTPWGKYRWLRLPFGLKIASDVFQERLDRVLRLLEGVHGIADDILTYGETEVHTWWKATSSTKDCKNEQPLTQSWQNTVQVYRLQVLWTQTHSRRPQTRSRKSQSHSKNASTAVYPKSTEFQWYGQLSKEIRPSLDGLSRAPKKTAKVRPQYGPGSLNNNKHLRRSRLHWLHSQSWHILIKTRTTSSRLMHLRLDWVQSYSRKANP